jgi:hypothetical protein
MFISAQGNYQLDGVLRTVIELSDRIVVSMEKSDFTNPDDAPPWCVDLLAYWESRTKSFYQIFSQTSFTTLEYAQLDCCFSGRLTINANNQLVEGQRGFFGDICENEGLVSDMSEALGLNRGVFYGNRGYQGWYDTYSQNILGHETSFQKWTQDMWWRLGAGDTVGEALMITFDRQPVSSDPNSPVNTFRFKGQGEIDNISLVGN